MIDECNAETAAELDEARTYAENLAVALSRHYPHVPQWKPLSGDLIGLLTQIDNMTTGLTAPIQATDAWDRIMEDRTLDRARSKISIRDIQVIIGHVRAAISQEPPASHAPVLRDAVIEECAKVAEAFVPGQISGTRFAKVYIAKAIRALASRPVSEREGADTAPAPAISGGEGQSLLVHMRHCTIDACKYGESDCPAAHAGSAALAAADRSAS